MNLPTPHSLADIAACTRAGGRFSYLLGDFLDAFYRQPAAAALTDAPDLLDGQHAKGAVYDAFLGACAETLAAQAGCRVPGWAFDEARYLHRPFFRWPPPACGPRCCWKVHPRSARATYSSRPTL